MKCENCGGILSLEDAACPHCGTVNKHAQKHIEDMKRYQGEFQNTRESVYAVTKNYAGITARAVIITVLLILIVIFAVITGSTYDIRRELARSKSYRNYDEYSARIEQYLEEENYMALSAFCYAIYMESYDSPYAKYAPIERACNQYAYLYESIMDAYGRKQEGTGPDEMAGYAENISDQLNYFYESLDPEHYSYIVGADSEENLAALDSIEKKVRLLLQTYCGLTEEEAAGLQSLSNAKRMVLLEEKMGNAE